VGSLMTNPGDGRPWEQRIPACTYSLKSDLVTV
jgi:hypothetical protein